MTYTDVFGNNTLPPSEYGYSSFNLTTDSTFVWPYNSSNASFTVAKVMDMTCSAGVSLVLPSATEVSTGEDFMVRNVGSETLTVKNASGVQIASVAVGAASYFYLTDNTSVAGVFGVIGFGVGTSTVDAASLAGYGIKAVGASLNQSHPVLTTASGITLTADHRSKLVVFTGGVATFSLTPAGVLGDDYFTMFRNDGTGTATIDPASSELVDGMSYIQVQPGESLILICTGTQWYSVGYGRSTLYQFTQLTKDVSAGGTITLSATEAANKLITFVGSPASAVNVVVPGVVAVYYTQSAISTAQTIMLKTAAGSGVGITQGTRIIALCDGTNVVSAQSAVANASVSLTDGSSNTPSLFFATQTNTGLFKFGTQDVGVTVGGSEVAVFGSTGLQTATIGPNSTQRHTLPAVTSDTVTLNAATQTLTNKTISVDSNMVSGVAASSFVLSDSSGNIDGAAAQKAIPTGVVVGTTDTQTLTNKTVNLTNNTLSGTKAQFDAALSDDNFAYVGQANTFTANQTLTVNSASDALKITQTGTGDALRVEDTSGDTTPFVIDQNGKVIVGHTAAIGNETVQQIGTAFASSASKSLNFAATNDGPYLIHGKSRGATVGDYTIVANNDALGTIQFQGADGSALVPAAAIRALVDGTPGLNDMPGRLVFSTTAVGASSSTERMRIDNAGRVGIATTSLTAKNVAIGSNITGATVAYGLYQSQTVQSDVTVGAFGKFSVFGTAAAAFTLPFIRHNHTEQGTIGAGSSITNQYGYFADSSLTGATNNYGFYGNIAAATGRYNFYANGTADNYFAGNVGIGGIPGGYKFSVAQTDATHAVAYLYNADTTATYNTDLQINNANVAGNALVSRRVNGEFWLFTSAAHPIAFYTNSAERMRVDSSGNVLVTGSGGLGYGTGSGGTVTQATSKSTAVTLNKPTGQITMNNAALAAGASVEFVINNGLVSTSDVVAMNVSGFPNYLVTCQRVASGGFVARLTNTSTGSLSEAVVINFAIIKGATA